MDGDWFYEKHDSFPGQAFGIEVEEVLFHEKSKYQDVLVFQSKTYGRVMVLDGIINSTSRDEYAYQEMITFLPLNSHPNPKKVLIVGGGDGGVARECVKHPKVETVTMVEIDQSKSIRKFQDQIIYTTAEADSEHAKMEIQSMLKVVVDVSKKYLPDMAIGMKHPKVKVFVEDGLEFLKNNSATYDVIIADLSDPDGPAAQLFQETFYKHMKERLNPDGILCTQGESIWLDLDLISSMLAFCKTLFPTVTYAYNNVPTYTCGCIGYIICSLTENKTFKEPEHVFTEEEKDQMDLKYYNEDIHRAVFALPRFVQKVFSHLG